MILFELNTPIFDISNAEFTIENGDHARFFFSILTNSNQKCDLSINICNSDGIVHTITAPNFFTNSIDCHYAKQLYDIPHVFTLENGRYTFQLTSTQVVHIFALHINEFDPNRKNDFGYQPPKLDDIPFYDCSYNNYVIIPNISAAYGGMWWCAYQAIVGIMLASNNNLIPIIDYAGGLYASNSIYDPRDLPKSWWNYFFDDPYPIHPDEKRKILEYAPAQLQLIRTHHRNDTILPIPETNCHYFHNNLFFRICRRNLGVIRDNIRKYIRPLPYINQYCDSFWHTCNPAKLPVVGVHYRGTDKYPTGTTSEGKPIHYKYDTVSDLIRNKLQELSITSFVLYCSSDEEPFIEHMKSQFENVVYNHHSIRSNVSTSGIHYNFYNIRFGRTGDTTQRSNYDYVKSLSLHFGHKDKSNYVKGFYALTDCLLFKPSRVLFVSQGNFSDFATYLTEPDTQVFHLNNLYKPYYGEIEMR